MTISISIKVTIPFFSEGLSNEKLIIRSIFEGMKVTEANLGLVEAHSVEDSKNGASLARVNDSLATVVILVSNKDISELFHLCSDSNFTIFLSLHSTTTNKGYELL